MGGQLDLATSGPEETRKLGAALAGLLAPGDVISLTGDLGAGKTCLVQGAARALGVEEPVGSPTFVLVREYRGDLPILHLDVYRLERVHEVLDLGFEDLLDPRAVIFIEWGDAIEALLPEASLEVALTADPETDLRRVQVRGAGSSWARRWEDLARTLAPWEAA